MKKPEELTTITFRLDTKLKDKIIDHAEDETRTMTSFIVNALKAYIDEREERSRKKAA